MEILIIALLVVTIVLLALLFLKLGNGSSSSKELEAFISMLSKDVQRVESSSRDEIRQSRVEISDMLNAFQKNLMDSLQGIAKMQNDQLKVILDNTQQSLAHMSKTIEERMSSFTAKLEDNNKANREEQLKSLQILNEQIKTDSNSMRDAIVKSYKESQESFDKSVQSFNELQRQKFDQLESRQNELVKNTEKKLEEMRQTVDEKLQKTLSDRIGQSFEMVSKQLESVQKGLGEMQTLAQDVGGLKKVLGNVKMRGGIGEVQLAMLLEQLLAPDQYSANVKTKMGSSDLVEFAVKLPGRDEANSSVWLPIDAKFPKDVYEQLLTAYDNADIPLIEVAQKNMDQTIKKMAKDIHDKYLDPPNTTDFGIMFLPFEGIYAEVVRKSALIDEIQREYNIIVTGPTTLAAILNSLQMGFKTLAIQKRSSEVWKVLGAVKKEFENFGGMLEKAHRNINSAGETIEKLISTRTKAINRTLRDVETLSISEVKNIMPEIGEGEKDEEIE